MNKLSPSAFFAEKLNAPLKSVRWSWGAVRESDGVIFFRCWADNPGELRWKDQKALLWSPNFGGKSCGKPERNAHVEALKAGANAFIVFAQENPKRPGSVGNYVEDRIWPIESLEVSENGDVWAKFGEAVSV